MRNVVTISRAARAGRRKPSCPEHLTGHARAEWERVIVAMIEADTFGLETAAVLEAYCTAYARWREAEAHVAKHGALVPAPRTGTPMHNPFLAIGNKAADTMSRLASELGLTPASRKRATARTATAERPDEGPSPLDFP